MQAELRLPQLVRYLPWRRFCHSLVGKACPRIGQMPAPKRFNQPDSKRAPRKNPSFGVGRVGGTGVAKEQLAGKQIVNIAPQGRGVAFGQHFQSIMPRTLTDGSKRAKAFLKELDQMLCLRGNLRKLHGGSVESDALVIVRK